MLGKNTIECKREIANRSLKLSEKVHAVKRVTGYSEVMTAIAKWEAALEEHESDTCQFDSTHKLAEVTKKE